MISDRGAQIVGGDKLAACHRWMLAYLVMAQYGGGAQGVCRSGGPSQCEKGVFEGAKGGYLCAICKALL